jgi:hypothetical protein
MRLRIPNNRCPARRFAAIRTACSAVLVMAGVAACSSGGAHAGGGSTADGVCAASSLKVTVDDQAAGAAAGSTYYPIDFTNKSGADCRLDGYPGAWFATSAGHQIGTAAV